MFKIKHLMDAVEGDDGARLWIEAVNLTKDLRQWCQVDQVLCHLGPPSGLCDWFEEHPDGYDYFRATYHDFLSRGNYKDALRQLACAAARQNFTLLYQGDDPQHNTATALYEFLSELSSYCPPDGVE